MKNSLTKIASDLASVYLVPREKSVNIVMMKTAFFGDAVMPMRALVDEPMRTHSLGSAFCLKMLKAFIAAYIFRLPARLHLSVV